MAQDRPRASIDGEMQGIEADLLLEATAYACFGAWMTMREMLTSLFFCGLSRSQIQFALPAVMLS